MAAMVEGLASGTQDISVPPAAESEGSAHGPDATELSEIPTAATCPRC